MDDNERRFFRVSNNPDDAPLQEHLAHGYEHRYDFYHAVSIIVARWHDRVGEAIGKRNGFLLLRFNDTPGGKPDEAWIPEYLLQPVSIPVYARDNNSTSSSEITDEINYSFGFD